MIRTSKEPLIIDSWSEWSACTETCGKDSLSYRTRNCTPKISEFCNIQVKTQVKTCKVPECSTLLAGWKTCGTKQLNFNKIEKTSKDFQRIVNGNSEKYGNVPYLCHLFYKNGHICGNSIIAPNWNIGAAHCLLENMKISDLLVTCGSFLRTETEEFEQTRKIERVFIPNNYKKNIQGVLDYDVALLMIIEAWVASDYIQPLCLPSARKTEGAMDNGVNHWTENGVERSQVKTHDNFTGRLCKVAGWGFTQDPEGGIDAGLSDELQSVMLPIAEISQCATGYKTLTRRQMCAGSFKGSSDSCQGDSGGALACEIEGRWESWVGENIYST